MKSLTISIIKASFKSWYYKKNKLPSKEGVYVFIDLMDQIF